MRQIKINTTLGSEIITASEVKNYVRIDTSADDALIATMITQARIWAENFISRDIVSKNRTYYIDRTDTGLFDLPFSPVASISEITINNIITTNYEILGLDNETIELDQGSADRVKITYITSGLNDSLLKQALLQLVSTYYDNRADFIVSQSVSEIPSNVKIVLSSYKTMFLR
jgi:uncharacterized phiE125 gp8 family phage protein